MAQLYAINTIKCIHIASMSSVSDSKQKMKQQHIELNLGSTTTTKQTSMLGLYAMNGGEGHLSYAQNSSYQRGVLDVAKPLLEEEIAAKLDHFNPNFRIADFGCSTGHNSFPAIEIITEAIEKKFETLRPEFQVFFNDQVMNDFNTLFHSLPQRKRNLYAAGVAGPFHGRLFPKASLDFAYSSCALNWLSQVPEAVADHTSPAWNKGRVHYIGAKHQVFEAYSNHYANDINSFLQARAEELVTGGLMALLVPADPAPRCSHGSATSFTTPTEIDLLGSCLVDMANKGIVSEERVDSFNFPLYFTIPEELKGIIERNMSFKIERMEIVNNIWGKGRLCSAKARAAYLRAVFEGMLINQFGREVMDQLFDRYTNKLAASPHFLDPHNEKSIIIFLLLKRN